MPRLTVLVLAVALWVPVAGLAQTGSAPPWGYGPAPLADTGGMPPGGVPLGPPPGAEPYGEPCDACGPGDECCPTPACSAATGPGGLLLFGDLLWLKARRTEPLVIQSAVTADPISGDLTVTRTVTDYGTDYQFGFRAGAGFLTESGWMFLVSFTRFEDDSDPQTFTIPQTVSPLVTLETIYAGPGTNSGNSFGTGSQVIGNWDLHYTTLDLMAGAVVSPADIVDINLSVGFRLAKIDQEYGFAAAQEDPVLLDEFSTFEQVSMDLTGAGPRVGLDGRLYVLPCLAVYGRGYTSVLLTHRNNTATRQDEGTTGGIPDPDVFFLSHDSREEVIPNLELAVGLELSLFSGHFLIGGGYETNYWFNLGDSNFDVAPEVNRSLSDVSLDGAYLSLLLLW